MTTTLKLPLLVIPRSSDVRGVSMYLNINQNFGYIMKSLHCLKLLAYDI